jgi:hypothetical protein
VTGASGACSAMSTSTISVGSYPATPTISQIGNVLMSSSASNNQWYFNGTLISGATAQSYTVVQDGNYSVEVSSQYGCARPSSTVSVILTSIEDITYINTIQLSPNPVKDVIFINTLLKEPKSISYQIYAITGQVVKSGSITLNNKESISISDMAAGVYEIKFSTNQSSSSYKFIKE